MRRKWPPTKARARPSFMIARRSVLPRTRLSGSGCEVFARPLSGPTAPLRYETQLLAHPEYADTFKEYLAIAAAADAIKREHARLNIPQSETEQALLPPPAIS